MTLGDWLATVRREQGRQELQHGEHHILGSQGLDPLPV